MTPRNWRSAPASAIQAPPAAMPAIAIRLSNSQGGTPIRAAPTAAETGRRSAPLAADDDEAELGRQRHAGPSAAGRCPLQGILPREPGAEGAPVHQRIGFQRVGSGQRHEDAEDDGRRQQRSDRDQDGFGTAAQRVERESGNGDTAVWGRRRPRSPSSRSSGGRADDAFGQPVHPFKPHIGLAIGLPGAMISLPVVLSGPAKIGKSPAIIFALTDSDAFASALTAGPWARS